MAAKSIREEELQLWNEAMDLVFESSSDESDSSSESSDSESSSDNEEEEDLQILNYFVHVARGRGMLLPRQKNYVETVVPTYSSKFFKENFRMFPATFEYLFELVAPELERRHNRGRPTISARKQLLIALWYMGTPDSYRSVCKTFDVGHATAVRAVRRVCHALHSLAPQFITWPREDKVDTTIADFRRKSPFPGVIGAIDGCHIVINAPKSSDGAYINRKGAHSIQFQAVCDAKTIFTHVYAGHVGSVHDQRVFRLSEVNDFLRSPDEYFPNDTNLIGDAAYKIDPHLMAPYKDNGHLTRHQNNFNHYLSKARMTIERAFGLLKARWRSLLHLLPMTWVNKILQYIVACCVLHNICELRGNVCNEPLPAPHKTTGKWFSVKLAEISLCYSFRHADKKLSLHQVPKVNISQDIKDQNSEIWSSAIVRRML